LNRVTSQRKEMLLELFIFLVLPIFVNILLVKVILSWWDERSNHLFIPEILPREILKPRMLLDF